MEDLELDIKIEKVTKIYDYYDAVEADVKWLIKEREQDGTYKLSWYLHENNDGTKWFDAAQACDDLENLAWDNDDITGNGSGSYTFDKIEAERNLVGNWGLLRESLVYMGQDKAKVIDEGPEWCDCLIRTHILENVILNILTDYDMEHTNNNDKIDPDDLPM